MNPKDALRDLLSVTTLSAITSQRVQVWQAAARHFLEPEAAPVADGASPVPAVVVPLRGAKGGQ
jgi:hypothetical protein